MINIESYYKGFMDGVECKDNYKIRLLGYDLTELLKIVDDHAMRKTMPTKAKMTRTEAIKLMKEHLPFSNNPDNVVDFYIAAGMLEIVEEEKRIVIDITEQKPVIIKRKGSIVYTE